MQNIDLNIVILIDFMSFLIYNHVNNFEAVQSALLFLLQLRIMSPDTVSILGATVALQVRLDVWSLLDGIVQLKHAIIFTRLLSLSHRLGESKLRSINTLQLLANTSYFSSKLVTYLEQNQIRIT